MEKVDYKCYIDQLIYGSSFHKIVHRRWFNPLRYLSGKKKKIYIHPGSVYLQGSKPDPSASKGGGENVKEQLEE